MTNAISVRKNEVNVVSFADNESGLVVTGSQKKEGFELKELSAETSHSKVINPGFFKYLSDNDRLQNQAGIALACYVDHGDGGADKGGKEGGVDKQEKMTATGSARVKETLGDKIEKTWEGVKPDKVGVSVGTDGVKINAEWNLKKK